MSKKSIVTAFVFAMLILGFSASVFEVPKIPLVKASDFVASGFTLEARNPPAGESSYFSQGIAANDTCVWGSGDFHIRLYNKTSFAVITTHLNAHQDGIVTSQINSLHLNDSKLYVGANNSTDGTGYVKIYWASNLSFIEYHQVQTQGLAEGGAWHGGYWWNAYYNYDEISQYDSDWNFVADHPTPYSGTSYQGITWLGDYAYCNNHNTASSRTVDILYWNGSGFEGIARIPQIGSGQNCSQGLQFDPDVQSNKIMWFCERNNPSGTHYAVNATTQGISFDTELTFSGSIPLAFTIAGTSYKAVTRQFYGLIQLVFSFVTSNDLPPAVAPPGPEPLYVPDPLIQYLIEGDFLGFIVACYTSRIGQGFYALIMLMVFGVLYNRTKSLALCGIVWLLVGSLLIVAMPLISPVAVILVTFGLVGILYDLVGSRR